MKALTWLTFLLSLMTCGTHVGNGLWDDEDDNKKEEDNKGRADGDFAPSESAGVPPTTVEFGPWKGLKASLDAGFHEDVPLAEDLLSFLDGKGGSIEEKRGEDFVEVLALEHEQNRVNLKNTEHTLIGYINTDKVFVYSSEYNTGITSAIKIDDHLFPSEAVDPGVQGAYHVLTATQRHELNWYQSDADTLILTVKIFNLSNETEASDAVYRIKK